MSTASHPQGEYKPNRRKPRMGAALVEWTYQQHRALVTALLTRGGDEDRENEESEARAADERRPRRRLH